MQHISIFLQSKLLKTICNCTKTVRALQNRWETKLKNSAPLKIQFCPPFFFVFWCCRILIFDVLSNKNRYVIWKVRDKCRLEKGKTKSEYSFTFESCLSFQIHFFDNFKLYKPKWQQVDSSCKLTKTHICILLEKVFLRILHSSCLVSDAEKWKTKKVN